MKEKTEHELRVYAIELYQQGKGFESVLRQVGRFRSWFAKWLRRFRKQGKAGLKDQSRVPHGIWRETPTAVVKKVLLLRDALEAHRTRRTAFSGIGAEAIQWELERQRIRKIPSLRTIERILERHGRTRSGPHHRSHGGGPPYPGPVAKQIGDLHQTDLVGPRHLRGPKGVTRFYSFHTVDVAGHTTATSQAPDKQAITLCRHLVGAWRSLGVPVVSQMDNEMAATGGGRYPHSLSQVIRLHLLLGVHLLFIPPGEPGRNATVESFNGLWQERVLHRHSCPTLAHLRRVDRRFSHYYHYQKPHRALKKKDQRTRFPGILRDRRWKQLSHLPPRFQLAAYLDAKAQLKFPVAKGKVSWIRKVDGRGHIDVNGKTYFIRRRLSGQYLIATLFTHRQRLVIKQESKRIKSFPFPIQESRIIPLLSFIKGRS